MDVSTFMVSVFCLIDDWLKGQRLRQRGPQPQLTGSEVLTMEVVGAFQGLETNSELYQHFRRYWADWFPAVRTISRTTFVRQATNLWATKVRLWQHLLTQVEYDSDLSLVDSFPVPLCQFARAYRCRRLAGHAAFGYDEMIKQKYYGLRAHLRVCWPGVIVGFSVAPANRHDLDVAEADLLPEAQGWALGDRNYWSPGLTEELRAHGLHLVAPYKSAKRDPHPWPRWLIHTRRRIETVFSQLVQRFHAKRVWAHDAWHFWSRWLRLIICHTCVVYLCQHAGLPPLRFAQLLID